MSLKNNLFNGQIPRIFNPKNFVVTNLMDEIISTTITSQQVQASSVQKLTVDGDVDDYVSQLELDEQLDDLKSLLLGSDALSNSLNSIVEINNAINNDPQFYTTITTSISTKANDNAVPHLTGTESIAGQKTFTTGITLNGTDLNTRLTSDESTIASHTTTLASHTTSINSLNSKTNAMTYNSGTNTLTMNENIVVALDESLNGNVTIGNASTDALIVNSGTTFNNGFTVASGTVSGLNKTMLALGNVDNTSDANKPVSTAQQTALNLKANDNSVVHLTNSENISGQKTFSTGITLNGSDLNTRLTNDESTISSHTSSISTINTNVSALQSKTNAMTYSGSTLTMNENVIVTLDEFLNGNTTIGNAGTDLLTVNSATTFNGSVAGLTKNTVGLSAVDNVSDLNKPISTLTQTALNLKANDSATCHNTGTETWAGVKTFSSSPVVPTCSANDNSTKVATTAYCDGAISTLIGGAPSALNSLNELALALASDANYSTTITTALATKGALSGNQSWSGDNTFTGDITFDGQDLASRLDTDETNIATLTTKCSALAYDSGTDTTTINSKMVVSKDVSDIGSIYLGDGVNNDIVYLRANVSANSQTVTPTQIGYLSTLSSNAQTQITARALDSAVVHNTGTESIAGQKTFSTGITLNGTDLNTRLTTDETNITNLQNKTNAMTYNAGTNTLTMQEKVIINLDGSLNANVTIEDALTDTLIINSTISANSCNITPTELSYIDGVTSSIQTQLNAKATDSLTCHLAGTETITGAKTFNGGVTLSSNMTSNAQTVTPTQLGYVSGLSSNAQTQITARALDSAVVHNTTDETIAGIKTFSSAPVLPSNSISNSMINNTAISSGYVDFTSSGQTQLNAKATDSLTCHLAGTETITGAKTFSGGVTLSSNITSNSQTVTPTQLGYVSGVTSAIQTQLDAKATDSLTCHLAGTETVTGIKTFSNYSYFNEFAELVNSVTSVTTSCSLDYTTAKGINYIQTPTANFSLALTNVPSPPSNCAVYSLTLMMAVKYYCNSITVNGTSRTLYFGGGSSNASINASASYVLQQINIQYLNSSTPVVTSNVLSLW
jgi:hypothetical protein